MSVYMTEEEQLDLIKQWWSRHQTWITSVLSVLLLIFLVVKYVTMHHEKVQHLASISYDKLMQASEQPDDKRLVAYARDLVNEYPKTVYADAAQLALTKRFVYDHDRTNARRTLEHLILHADQRVMADLARLRLARIHLYEKNYPQAFTLLAQIKENTLTAAVLELQGDLYAKQGQMTQARQTYQQALALCDADGINHSFLQMKMSSINA